QVVRQILELRANVVEARHFGLAGHQRPDQHGDCQRQEFPVEVAKKQAAHVRQEFLHGSLILSPGRLSPGIGSVSSDSGISAAYSSIRRGAARCTSKCRLMRSSTSERDSPCSNSPKAAMEMRPVSSDTTIERQSVSSVIPMAARWRVPSCCESAGL